MSLMINTSLSSWLSGWTLLVLLASCSTSPPSAPTAPSSDNAPADSATASGATGTLDIRANGEAFVREGLTTKDGWQITFEHLYVTLAEVTAYQSDPAYDAKAGGKPEAQEIVSVAEPVTVDLAAGDPSAEPALVATVPAPAGRYNALSWDLIPASTGAAEGTSILIQGQATKADTTLPFTLALTPTLAFTCGDYVGDERKGILTADGTAELEATFHFDHLFGDGTAPATDAINTGALGFDPLAAIATGDALEATSETLKAQLTPEDHQLLMEILPNLGHVGEGHCAATTPAAE